jgi:aminoglycoside phosphotransferase (APT) family kinase protein
VIAQGRDTEILDHGPGLVLRRPRVARSMASEAAVMTWVRAQGYPCPEVVEVVDEGIVMQRIEGVAMLDVLPRQPHRMRAHATLLADLHGWLHLLPGHELVDVVDLGHPFGSGATLLHADLHPGNVLLTADGPVVIDWSNAALGPAGADLAVTWLLMAAGQPDASRIELLAVKAFRRIFVRAFLAAVDRDEAARGLRVAYDRRLGDTNLSAAELATMSSVVEQYAR